ncbi:Uncharacterized peptidase U32 family member YhbV [hydrothermal vent metagenome]|uniref:Uncharacterized peptidase U32 family member YhbV n=1 Tax=hydrothermal vent metagenome TaxID=652676 RepID=A0A3B1AA49_9ZZZZ
MKLSLGNIQYFWPRNTVYEFYESIAEQAVDIVYLGESVCAKRRELKLQDWLDIAESLVAAGKEVVLSTLTLIEAESELSAVRKICQQKNYSVEANDMSAVQILSSQGINFIAGPFINIYNQRSLAVLQQLGLKRWVMPVELSQESAQMIIKNNPEQSDFFEIEIFAYGKLPLAYSARCFTARSKKLTKDDCQFICRDYPNGMDIISQNEKNIFTVNGIQTQSGEICDLSNDIESIKQTGVNILRISPQLNNTPEIINKFNEILSTQHYALNSDTISCNGYWHNKAGMLSQS